MITLLYTVMVEECTNKKLNWKPGTMVVEDNETFSGAKSFTLGAYPTIYLTHVEAQEQINIRSKSFVGVRFKFVEWLNQEPWK